MGKLTSAESTPCSDLNMPTVMDDKHCYWEFQVMPYHHYAFEVRAFTDPTCMNLKANKFKK